MDTWLSVTLYNLFIEKIHRKEKQVQLVLIECLSLYLKYHYKPNKYDLIIQGGYLVPEKDVHRCTQDPRGGRGEANDWG